VAGSRHKTDFASEERRDVEKGGYPVMILAVLMCVSALFLVVVKSESAPSCTALAFLFTWLYVGQKEPHPGSEIAVWAFGAAPVVLVIQEMRKSKMLK
jgi:hypothetical protein